MVNRYVIHVWFDDNILTYTFLTTCVFNCCHGICYSDTYVLVLIPMVHFTLGVVDKCNCQKFKAEQNIICVEFWNFSISTINDIIF